MLRWVIATRNRHKVQEIGAILGHGVQVKSMLDYADAPPLLEDAETFEGNARRKAVQLLTWLRSPGHTVADSVETVVLADDSGLEVEALDGAPGVYSARFAADEANAEGNAPDQANNRKLLRLLSGLPPARRRARFRCVLAVAGPWRPGTLWSAPAPLQVFEGTCEGHIALEPAGQGGFGYDPLFVPDGESCTFAQLGEAIKNRISHLARALAALSVWLGKPLAGSGNQC